MNIQYQNAVVGAIPAASQWLPGVMQAIPTGGYSVQKPDGKYLRVNVDGALDETDAIEPLAAFVPDSQINVLRVGYGTDSGPRFALYYRFA